MFDNSDLDAAIKAGILPAEAAENLRNFAAKRSQRLPADDEQLRLSSGLFDIFVSIGIVLLLFGIYVAGRSVGPPAGFVFVAAAWLLAEYFVHDRRMLMPGFILLAAVMAGGAVALFAVSLTLPGPLPSPSDGIGGVIATSLTPLRYLVISAGVACLCWLYWMRFAVAIATAATALMLYNVPSCLVHIVAPRAGPALDGMLLLACGIATFVVAMWWDMTDIYRQTRRADVAFWLHGLAGFVIANVVLRLAIGMPVGSSEPFERFRWTLMSLDTGQALSILAIYALFAIVSLIIDRRALMMAGLVFAFSAFATLSGATRGTWPVLFGTVAMALLILATAIWWIPIRRQLLALLPQVLRAQLPRTELPYPRPRPIS